mmetsp:Transcript_11305/g.25745  ORF Transcript_11305/g.25745 Transcript_11305/m.25745 type:complete len:341 (-) Transcript_11305:25-1047(-)
MPDKASEALKLAVKDGNAADVDALLKQRADPNEIYDYGVTALHLAALHNRTDAVSSLLAARANPHVRTEDQITAVEVAEAEDNQAIVELLRHNSVGSRGAVTLNIYDVSGSDTVQFINKVFRPVGTGAFHAAVEIHGKEWSFGATPDNRSGIFSCPPRACSAHSFREAIPMGEVALSEEAVKAILMEIEPYWMGQSYDLLRHNCCHFSDNLCRKLGVGGVPRWVTNLAGAGASLEETAHTIAQEANRAAIVAAAKADQIDKQFQVRETVAMSAQYNRRKVLELNEKLKISETVVMSADYNRRKLAEIVTAGKESRGSGSSSSYKLGDFTRGVMAKFKRSS